LTEHTAHNTEYTTRNTRDAPYNYESDPSVVKGRIFEIECEKHLLRVFDEVQELRQDKYGGLQPDFLCRKEKKWFLVECKDIAPSIVVKTARGKKSVHTFPENFKPQADPTLPDSLTVGEMKEAFEAGRTNWMYWAQDFEWMWTNLFQKKWHELKYINKENKLIELKKQATPILIVTYLWYGYGVADEEKSRRLMEELFGRFLEQVVWFHMDNVEERLRKIVNG